MEVIAMKRPEPEAECKGSRKPHPRHIPDGYGFGICGGCQEQKPFKRINGKTVPIKHPPKKAL
jgi:hypothetical protein